MAGLRYDTITRYKVTAICEGPLHIGSAVGGKEEVLIDPIDGVPFIQASSIAGVFRSYCQEALKDNRTVTLFGSGNVENMSRLRFEDGHFSSEIVMEYRPHVSIDRSTGSVGSKVIKGTLSKSGQKFNLEYIGAGAEMQFDMYLYEDLAANGKLDDLVNAVLSAMKEGILRFGGKKSNGGGVVRLTAVCAKKYDLRQADDRKAWVTASDTDLADMTDKLVNVRNERLAYSIEITGTTENYIQVKGINVSGSGEDAPDSQNIQNAKKDYIVPGSSFKGAVRAQMEKIAGYLHCTEVILSSFGEVKADSKNSHPGNLMFYDTVIGDREFNDAMPLTKRIHIDKFTGGVFNKGYFNEKNAAGDLHLKIDIIDRNTPEKTLALLLFALRDLAVGAMSIGGGYSTGKGIINVSDIEINSLRDNHTAKISYNAGNGTVSDGNDIIDNAIHMLKGGCQHEDN